MRFKFLNCLVDHPGFFSFVQQGWDSVVPGVKMFQVWTRLKKVRTHLKQLTQYYSKAQIRVVETRQRVDDLQTAMQTDPPSVSLFRRLSEAQSNYDFWSKV